MNSAACMTRTSVWRRVLAFGIPADRLAAKLLSEAATDIAVTLAASCVGASTAHSSLAGTLASLLEALLCGLASLSYLELHTACEDVLQTAGSAMEEGAVHELAKTLK